jgi:hypothetical protein
MSRLATPVLPPSREVREQDKKDIREVVEEMTGDERETRSFMKFFGPDEPIVQPDDDLKEWLEGRLERLCERSDELAEQISRADSGLQRSSLCCLYGVVETQIAEMTEWAIQLFFPNATLVFVEEA